MEYTAEEAKTYADKKADAKKQRMLNHKCYRCWKGKWTGVGFVCMTNVCIKE